MTRVFLCHSNHDISIVREMKKNLKRGGIDSWLAEDDIRPGQIWEREISNALNKCSHFIVIMSPSATQSEEVKFEVEYAFRESKFKGKIIPLMLKKCDPRKIHYKLSGVEWHPVNLEGVNSDNAGRAIESIEETGKIPAWLLTAGVTAGAVVFPLVGPMIPILVSAILAAADTDN